MVYLVLALIAGLAAVERKGFLQAMLSRPITLAPLAGWALGDLQGGLLLAAPLELFWLGAVNLGAALPVHEALGTAAITGGAVLAGEARGGGTSPEIALLAVLICAPLALAGRRADRFVEAWNEHLARRAEAELSRHHLVAAVRPNILGLLLPFGIAAVLAPLGALAVRLAVPAILETLPGVAMPLRLGFFAFAAIACASGAKALRANSAPSIFFTALGIAIVAVVAIGRFHA